MEIGMNLSIKDRWVWRTLNTMSHERLVAFLEGYGFDCGDDSSNDLRQALLVNIEDGTIELDELAAIAEELGTNDNQKP
jgi:hypothetical protein